MVHNARRRAAGLGTGRHTWTMVTIQHVLIPVVTSIADAPGDAGDCFVVRGVPVKHGGCEITAGSVVTCIG